MFEQIWREFFDSNCSCNRYTQRNRTVRIQEGDSNGQGYIDIRFKQKNLATGFNYWIYQCNTSQSYNIRCIKNNKKPDGLIFAVDFTRQKVHIVIVELKKTITHKLDHAQKQIASVFPFINALALTECFDVCFTLVIGYESLNKQNFSLYLSKDKTDDFKRNLYEMFLKTIESNGMGKIPIRYSPFCGFKVFDLRTVDFSSTLDIILN